MIFYLSNINERDLLNSETESVYQVQAIKYINIDLFQMCREETHK